ncbi:MAG TPA: hypothetical protein VJ624_05750 [Thermodesulfobacteriota bacterium]|nr:hypothetical protein [Thermodesulfobacteriota bacterium]
MFYYNKTKREKHVLSWFIGYMNYFRGDVQGAVEKRSGDAASGSGDNYREYEGGNCGGKVEKKISEISGQAQLEMMRLETDRVIKEIGESVKDTQKEKSALLIKEDLSKLKEKELILFFRR